MSDFFVHETAVIDKPCKIGSGTKIWHFTHIMNNCSIGEKCNFWTKMLSFHLEL